MVHDHTGYRLTVFFLFRGVHTVGVNIHRECMYCVLHLEILDLAVVVWIVLMDDRDGPAVTGRIDPMQARVKLDYIYSVWQLEKSNGLMLVEVKNCH